MALKICPVFLLRPFPYLRSLAQSLFLIPGCVDNRRRRTAALIGTSRRSEMFPQILPGAPNCSTDCFQGYCGSHHATDLIMGVYEGGGQGGDVNRVADWLIR